MDSTARSRDRILDAFGLLRRLSLGRYVGVSVGFVAVSVYLWATQPVFMTWTNWENIIRAQSVVAMLAVGMTFVILTGAIDLSVASMTAVATMAIGLSVQHGAAWWVAVLAGVGTGLALGLINGLLIGAAKITFFVVTLGTLSIYQSIALLSTNGETIPLFEYPSFEHVSNWANGSWGRIPSAPLFVLLMYVVGSLVLRYTTFGRAVYAVGSNREAARLTGVNVTLTTIAVFAICGLTAGMGAVIQTGRLTGATPQVDPNLMLAVIAAVLIGGASFSGGDGSLFGTILGVLFLGLIQNGLTISGVSTFWQGTVSGLVLISAVAIGVIRSSGWSLRRRKEQQGRQVVA
jgi:ribose/xylose/arabinose/galactoside ABC-type transport system permease subunit